MIVEPALRNDTRKFFPFWRPRLHPRLNAFWQSAKYKNSSLALIVPATRFLSQTWKVSFNMPIPPLKRFMALRLRKRLEKRPVLSNRVSCPMNSTNNFGKHYFQAEQFQ